MNDEMKTTTEVSGPWECFSDPCYYDMARLRRKDGPKDFNTGFHLNTLREAQELRDILNRYEARLALVPEEPVIKEPLTTEPAPEWRELGPDEVIQEGDEVFSLGMWIPVSPNLVIPINDKRKPEVRFRTRRLLPKQEEERLLKVMEYCRKWADEHLAGHGKETFYARLGLLVDFATDLHRDEIQKLKEAKP